MGFRSSCYESEASGADFRDAHDAEAVASLLKAPSAYRPKDNSVNRPTQIIAAATARYSPAVGSSPMSPRSQRARWLSQNHYGRTRVITARKDPTPTQRVR